MLAAEHDDFVRALDPLAPDGAVARFLRALREELRNTEENCAKQLIAATAALDLNDPRSLVSRLLTQSHTTSHTLLHAVNPDATGSAMSVMKATVMTTLHAHFKENGERLDTHEKRQLLFQQQVTDAPGKLDGARRRDRRSPRGGFDFEDQVQRF